MKYFVTGATGFVGSHLVDLLISEGHEVYSLVRSEEKAKNFHLGGNYILGSLQSEGNIDWLSQLPEDIDVVYHIAGIVHSPKKERFFDINTRATENLFLQLKKKFDDLHFIFVSSLAAGGPSEIGRLRTISDQDSPVSIYGQSKKDAEEAIIQVKENFKLTIFRPPLILGPRDPAIVDVYKMVKSRIILGPGNNFLKKEYSFIYVKDLVKLLYYSSKTRTEGTFYTANQDTISFIDILDAIKQTLKINRLIYITIPDKLLILVAKLSRYLPISDRFTEDKVNELLQRSWSCQGNDINLKLGYSPETNFLNAAKETTRDYKNRGWI